MTAYADDERAGLQIVGVLAAGLLLPALHACEWGGVDTEACNRTLAHRQALSQQRAAGTTPPIALRDLRGCAESLTDSQAICAQNAKTLDGYEQCFF